MGRSTLRERDRGREREREEWFVIVEFFKFSSLHPLSIVPEIMKHSVQLKEPYTWWKVCRGIMLSDATKLLISQQNSWSRVLFKEKWASVISSKETKSVFRFASRFVSGIRKVGTIYGRGSEKSFAIVRIRNRIHNSWPGPAHPQPVIYLTVSFPG